MGNPPIETPANRWFDRLLHRLPAAVRYRLFTPAYEDLHHDYVLHLRTVQRPIRRAGLRIWFACCVLVLVMRCYCAAPGFLFVHPFRACASFLRALVASNRIMAIQDIRQGLRRLRQHPLIGGIAILILALGIGASTSIFSVVDAVLLRPLPFPDAGRLVAIEELFAGRGSSVSPVNFLDWRRDARSFQSMALYLENGLTLAAGDHARAVDGYAVSSTFFPTLGVQPELGRFFASEDDRAGGPSSVVLSHGLWMDAFRGALDVVGLQVLFDGAPYTVVGVAPRGAEFPEGTEAWFSLALSARATAPTARGAHYADVIARLRPGVSVAEANAEMQAIAARLAAAYPRHNKDYSARVTDLLGAIVGDAGRGLLFVFGAVACLLLIACVNVSGLLMAQAATRRTEMAVRAALGAGRLALVRQVLIESLILSALAAGLGVLLASWGTGALMAIVPTDLPRTVGVQFNPQAMMFALLVAAGAALLFGTLPALQSMTASFGGWLKESRRDGGIGGSSRVRGTLIALEVALALVLLIGAGLAIRSFDLLARVSPGFDPRRMLMFSVSLPDAIYKEPRQAAVFYQDLVEKLDRLPGIVSSTAVMVPPVAASGFGGTFSIEGRAQPSGVDEPRAQLRAIEPGFFRTLGVPLTAGRAFTAHDSADAPPVAIISETTARRFWPGEDPIGRRLRMHVSAVRGQQPFREIVGIAADVKTSRLDAPTAPVVYVPHPQHPAGFMTVLVRTSSDPEKTTGSVLGVLRRIDSSLAPIRVKTMEDHVAASRADQRFRAVLLGLFSGSAFLLAMVGLYAVTAYSTNRRRHEIGVRIALGATAQDIERMVLAEGMRPVVAGIIIGCGAGIAMSRVMAGLLFGVRPFEPSIVAGVAALLAATAAAACYLPARRAAAADPRKALQAE